MVRWHHLIITAYGFWLPNDPRGSWSDFVGAWELLRLGQATKVDDKRSYAHDPHDRARRLDAKRSLKYPAVRFNAGHRDAVSRGFPRAIAEGGYIVHACCIGFDHAHLVTQRHARTIERIAGHLKSKAAMELRAAGNQRAGTPAMRRKRKGVTTDSPAPAAFSPVSFQSIAIESRMRSS